MKLFANFIKADHARRKTEAKFFNPGTQFFGNNKMTKLMDKNQKS
jgi:hypothetical protein